MDDASKIITDIANGKIAPVYFLMGDESYYIDMISDYIESSVLTEDERSFNQTVFYGRDSNVDDIVSTCRRFPMMADRQVVLLKEAQDLKELDNFTSYIENPMTSTVLVICYKNGKLDARKKISKVLAKKSVVLESKKLYDNMIPTWIKKEVARRQYQIDQKSVDILAEFLGTSLTKINNELNKLEIILPKGSAITPEIIEENIGFSKDFNNFEFRNAIAYKDKKKAYFIAQYFSENPKANPLIVTTSQTFQFFSVLLQYHALKDKSSKSVNSALRLNSFQVKEYEAAAKHYPMKKVSNIVAAVRELDVRSKGVGASLPHSDLLKEVLIKIFA